MGTVGSLDLGDCCDSFSLEFALDEVQEVSASLSFIVGDSIMSVLQFNAEPVDDVCEDSVAFLQSKMNSCCQANVLANKARVFPVPVGDSSNAFSLSLRAFSTFAITAS